jgi:choline dehydrogenase-like flavoprotein
MMDARQLSAPPASGRLACEALVIGSGAGGSVVACDLAEAGVDVLVLEEGDYLPLDVPAPYTTREMIDKYRQGGLTPALGRPPVAYVEARCVGGGTEVNSGLYHAPPADALARWRAGWKVADLTEASLAPHVARCERDLSIAPLPGPAPAASRLLAEGARRRGWAAPEVPRWFHFDGTPSGAGTRASMTRTLLPRALARGARLLPGCRVESLRWRGGRVVGAVARARGRRVIVEARSVIVCAGAVHGPALLRRSGVTKNVGDTLAMHPTVKVVAQWPEQVDAWRSGVPVHQVREFAPALSLGGSVSTPGHLALSLANNGPRALEVMPEWRRCAVYYAAARGEPRGVVRNVPGAGVVVRYDVTDATLGLLSDGVARLGEALLAAGATTVWPCLREHPPLRAPADCRRYLGGLLPRADASLMTVHLFSSAPMGEDRARCACDSWGKVHGVEGLWVADASLLPDAPGCNPQGTIVALARRVAARLLETTPWRR